MNDEEIHSSILELSKELNATQRALARLQNTSATILDKLDRILKEHQGYSPHVEVGYM
ncbi:MAG: hypothetical protein ACHQ1D_02360 [Nitrososphaerales archaeon]